MKTFLPLVLLSALLHAEEPAVAPAAAVAPAPVPAPAVAPAPAIAPAPAVETHAESAESAESGSPVGGAGERSESEGVSHAEPAEAEPHAESAESAESGSPAGGAGERSEPEGVSHAEPAEPAAPGGGVVAGNDATGGNDRQLELVDNSPPSSERGVARSAGGSSPCGSKHCAKRRPPLRAEVSLIDGSILKGTLRQHAIPARSPNLGDIRVRLGKVESIVFGKPGAPAKIAFKNGDALSAKFPADRAFVTMDTLVGRVRVPFDKVVSLSIEQPHSALSTQHSALLYHCTFDSQAAVERPAAGPAGKFLRGSFVPGRNGRALRVEADTPAFESMLPKGFLGPEGTIEFWAKIEGDDPRYVDGGDPLFVSLYDERGAITLLQFAANNGFARGGLGGAFVSWPFGTIPHYSWSMEYRKVLGEDWAGWHHYAMSWKAGGFGDGSFAKVFVDGKPQPVLGGVDDDKLPARLADYANHAHDLGIPWSAARSADHRRSKKPFLVDDLRIWSVAKTDFAGSSAATTEPPKLLYHCTFDDAQSVERPAAGPSGKLLGGEFVPGKKDKALRIPGNVPTALVDLPRGFLQPKGTIEFWSKIEAPPASYGDRGNPRFFGLSLFDDPANPGPCSTYLQFTSNDGMGMSGLCGMIYHRAMATDPHMRTNTYGPILEDPSAWHHYAIVWDSDGLPFSKASDGTPAVAAIVLDGRVLQTFGRNQFAHGKGLLRLPELQGKLAFPVSDTNWGFFPRPIAFLIDDFKIWSVVKTDFIVSSTEPPNRRTVEPPKLLYHCTFDSPAAVERPAAGPNGRFLGGEFVPGKKGNALRTFADEPAAEVDFEPGFLGTRGTIEFWAKMEEATKETVFGDGGNPRFFCLWIADDMNRPGVNPRSSYLQWSGNDGGGRSGLCAMVRGAAATTENGWGMRRYPEFLGDPAAWHHYAVVWDEAGVSGTEAVLAIYVDGIRIPSGGNDGLVRGRNYRRFLESAVLLGFPQRKNDKEPAARHVPFLIDEFKIWSAPKTDFGMVARPIRPYRPELLYHCTFDSAEAVEKSAAGPAGKFLGGEFVPGKVGNALRSPGDVPVAEVDLPKGFLQPRGTIEFWTKIEEPPAFFGDRGNPLFFGTWLFENPDDPGLCSTHLGWCANNGMGMAGLCGMVYHRAMATDPTMRTNTYGPLLSDPAAWHHYAIVWDSEGLPFSEASDGTPAVATLVLDGKVLQTFGRNQLSKGEGLLKLPSFRGKLAFPIPAARWGNPGNHVPFLIDEFKIWSAPKTDFAIPPAAAEPPRLLYHCTFDDAAAIERPAAGPSGKYLGGDFVPGKQGTALRVYADAPAAQTAFKPGDLGRRGMFEFWAKMEEATMETVFGDGGNPRFFCLWADLDKPGANPRSTYLQWSGNDGSGRSGLCAMVSGCTATSEDGWGMRRYPAFLGNPSDWHHYAVVWDENGVFGSSSVVAVYVDGKLVSTGGRNELSLGRKFKSFLDGPVLLGFPQRENEREPAARHVPFLIDEFKIWSAPVVQTK